MGSPKSWAPQHAPAVLCCFLWWTGMKVGTDVIRTAMEGQTWGWWLGPRVASYTFPDTELNEAEHELVRSEGFMLTVPPEAAWCALLCCSSSFTVIFTRTPWYTLGFSGERQPSQWSSVRFGCQAGVCVGVFINYGTWGQISRSGECKENAKRQMGKKLKFLKLERMKRYCGQVSGPQWKQNLWKSVGLPAPGWALSLGQ